jgi:hypothetical protein
MGSKFCYWSVADGDHGKMMATCIASARQVGVTEDFHIWSDQEIPGAISHPCGNFSKHKYLFKFLFLLNEVKKLDYDYFVWLDADNFFTRHPGIGVFDKLLIDNKIFVQLENECTDSNVKRPDWWGMPIKFWPQTLRYKGVVSKKIWNTNAGLWVVRKEYIDEFYNMAMDFWAYCYQELKIEFTEEAPLAYCGHMMQKNLERSTLYNTHSLWACDWNGIYRNKLPDGQSWSFEDFMTGERISVNPSIVHAMRSKGALIKGADLLKNEIGFWMGYTSTEDIIAFCEAAQMVSEVTKYKLKVNFDEASKRFASYFSGIEWVPKKAIPDAVDCGLFDNLPNSKSYSLKDKYFHLMI